MHTEDQYLLNKKMEQDFFLLQIKLN